MNWLHRWYCKSGHWKRTVENQILPWALDGIGLGASVLEVGPGPGVTTDWLRHRVQQLECLELDHALAASLERRFSASNVTVRSGDATAMPYEDGRFTSVLSFTMMHHIRTRELQDRFLSEAYRVLRPGGIFAGVDSLSSILMSIFHVRDTLTLVGPDTLTHRLASAGFIDAHVDVGSGRFRFSAKRSVDSITELPAHSRVATGENFVRPLRSWQAGDLP
jgi:ubiquinone/menaquinone biosynthesis C-methylase UbiE